MLAAVGDLVDDIVVRRAGPINVASDTSAVVDRRRGGSAANVAFTAARRTGSARFLGQVGDDALGSALLAELNDEGVDVDCVRRRGRTGSIVVLVDADGERSFLTDPGDSRDLDQPQEAWLEGVDVLHVPLYSLSAGPIADTATTLIHWAHRRSIPVSIDMSSVALIAEMGVTEVLERVEHLRPDVVFANVDEAALLGIEGPFGGALTIVKRGAQPAIVHASGDTVEVPAQPLEHVVDTTGAGDSFAAGVLTNRDWMSDPVAACVSGHEAAAALLRSRAALGEFSR